MTRVTALLDGENVPNNDPRCAHCRYKLVKGQCPIPCKGRPLRELVKATEQIRCLYPTERERQALVTYWSPKVA